MFLELTDELFEESVSDPLEKLGEDQGREAADELDDTEEDEGQRLVGGQIHHDVNLLLLFLSLGAVGTPQRSDSFKFPQKKTEKGHLNFYLEKGTVNARTRKEFCG